MQLSQQEEARNIDWSKRALQFGGGRDLQHSFKSTHDKLTDGRLTCFVLRRVERVEGDADAQSNPSPYDDRSADLESRRLVVEHQLFRVAMFHAYGSGWFWIGFVFFPLRMQ